MREMVDLGCSAVRLWIAMNLFICGPAVVQSCGVWCWPVSRRTMLGGMDFSSQNVRSASSRSVSCKKWHVDVTPATHRSFCALLRLCTNSLA